MDRRQIVTGLAIAPAALALPAVAGSGPAGGTPEARARYRLDAAQAHADLTARLAAGGDFDRELARFELEAQLMRERHNVFLWDGPTTARGYRHPSWGAL